MFELGYRLSFWNLGNGGAWTRGNFHCGGFSPWNTNVCIVNLPNDGEGAERLVQYGILYDLLRVQSIAGIRIMALSLPTSSGMRLARAVLSSLRVG